MAESGPRWQGSAWIFDVFVCPECHAQVDESQEDGAVCWEHGRIVEAVRVQVAADAGWVLDQLRQLARQQPPPGS